MPKGTISYRIASEAVGIDVADVRYRATRSSRLATTPIEGDSASPAGPWTLWHDDREGGSHSVGYWDAYEGLEKAVEAARQHTLGCQR